MDLVDRLGSKDHMKNHILLAALLGLVNSTANGMVCKVDLEIRVGEKIEIITPGNPFSRGIHADKPRNLVDDDGHMTLSLLRYSWAQSAAKSAGWSIPNGDLVLFTKALDLVESTAQAESSSYETTMREAGVNANQISAEGLAALRTGANPAKLAQLDVLARNLAIYQSQKTSLEAVQALRGATPNFSRMQPQMDRIVNQMLRSTPQRVYPMVQKNNGVQVWQGNEHTNCVPTLEDSEQTYFAPYVCALMKAGGDADRLAEVLEQDEVTRTVSDRNNTPRPILYNNGEQCTSVEMPENLGGSPSSPAAAPASSASSQGAEG